MHPEIEKLIDLTLTDGKLSEKEKNVIIKKAKELGEDIDELEIIIDAKLQQLEIKKPINEKVGNLKTCPACGVSVKAMTLLCNDCGHEFQNKKANQSITDLIEKLEKEDNKNYKQESDRSDIKSKIITQFPIPQTKEDIFEFLTFSFPFLENQSIDDDEKQAWITKVGQAILKAKITTSDAFEKETINEYDRKLQKIIAKEKRSTAYMYILLALAFLLLIFVIYHGIIYIIGIFVLWGIYKILMK